MESESDQTAAVVTYQYPHAGATVASGTTIYLYTDTYSGSHTEVPDVSGKSADFARQMLTAAGLNCQVAGDSAGTVQSQSEAAGSSVQKAPSSPSLADKEIYYGKIAADLLLKGLAPEASPTASPSAS